MAEHDVNRQGRDITGAPSFSGRELTIPNDMVAHIFAGPITAASASVTASEPSVQPQSRPTLYEVRRDALRAAAEYCGSGWGGAENVIEKVARPFEQYLLEVRDR